MSTSIEQEIIPILAKELRNPFIHMLQQDKSSYLQEIRLRVNQPTCILFGGQEYFITHKGKKILSHNNSKEYLITTTKQLSETTEYISKYSKYAFQEEIRQGYLTIQGGHRIGLVGKVTMVNGTIHTLHPISGMNIRIAHQIQDCATPVLPWLYENGQVVHTLVVGPPGSGKTTLLRDCIRQISNGTEYGEGKNVGLADERSEVAACYQGIPQNDVGIRTDVLDGCPKAKGMLMLLRSMNPMIIATDEVGTKEDMEAIRYISSCGCSILVSVHGSSLEEVTHKPVLSELMQMKIFKRYILLSYQRTHISVYNEHEEQLTKINI
jgi:stage III sporulation protein AA